MFEKDVLQLIRGLRAHKGQEREYIQSSLRECRKEVKSQDMDVKAIALLKLVYLEMFGHDMGWASFNVLEVMSSQKYPQKRVGYLAAVQTFRPDTEVLMLAENLLKKDLGNTERNTITLALGTIPHVVNPGMANSLLTDLLPRLSHSNPDIRKKTIVTLYRLALVYPETLRPAWPKIKERLLDEDEDPSVTSAIVNVVCELGWRRPHDFLPLAPRFFELLTQGGNNWMGIKIIKLFSALTPIEPRLVKKLLPPLTQLINTTPAMSLLYECINGIIQGGIMEAAGGTTEGDEVARLCIGKLRGMLVVQNDPNLRYVALLAFAKITASHADLVAEHQDVILECIDDPDISIRTRALDLVIGMVNANNLQQVVERLLRQLRTAETASAVDDPYNDRGAHEGVVPLAEEDGEDAQLSIRRKDKQSDQPPPLPETYRALVIERILDMCSKDMYANMSDFEWYIGVLVDLVKQCPSKAPGPQPGALKLDREGKTLADSIGAELLNVAVRVKAVRGEAAAAAQALLLVEAREELFVSSPSGAQGVLAAAAFIAGEYATSLPDADAVLASLLHPSSLQLSAAVLTSYLQAVPKIFAVLASDQNHTWTLSRRSQITLLTARTIHFLEPLTLHPSVEVQERAVEYLELLRLASEASNNQIATEGEVNASFADPPLLLTQAIPLLFSGMDLNPVAPSAIRQVPLPEGLDLDAPINTSLHLMLQQADYDTNTESHDENDEVRRFYYDKPAAVRTGYNRPTPAADLLEAGRSTSYQGPTDREHLLDAESLARKRAEKRERYRDDPYYIDSERNSGTSTPMGNIIRSTAGGEELDVDAIPVMELKLQGTRESASDVEAPRRARELRQKKPRRHFEIAADETLGPGTNGTAASQATDHQSGRLKKSVLQVDSSGLSSLSLDAADGKAAFDADRRAQEDEEMARAMREIERLRLEMQRRTEEIPEVGDGEGVIVKKRRKKVRTGVIDDEGDQKQGERREEDEAVRKKKKKGKKKIENEAAGEDAEEEDKPKPKKKKRVVTFEEQPG